MRAKEQRQRLLNKLRHELGVAVLAAVADRRVTEILINPDGRLWCEVFGKGMHDTGIRFSPQQVELLLGTIAALLGTVINARVPILSGELPLDGSRVEGMLPPVSPGPTLVIRKHPHTLSTLDDYVTDGIMQAAHAARLRQAIRNRENILIAGGTGSGKTTLANALLYEMVRCGRDSERFVILEDTVELHCDAQNVVPLRTTATLTLTHLVRESLRMRPDRLIIGEVRGGEALDFVKALNTGHRGSLTTIHANSAREALSRLALLIQEAGVPPMPHLITEAIDVVVALSGSTTTGRRVDEVYDVNKSIHTGGVV